MKTIYGLLTIIMLILTLFSCTHEELPIINEPIPSALVISEPVGLSVETQFVTENIGINVKVTVPGTYIIKLHHISGRVVVKDEVYAKAGDNIKTLYVGAIPKEPYTLSLYNKEDVLLAKTVVNIL